MYLLYGTLIQNLRYLLATIMISGIALRVLTELVTYK